MAAALQTLEEVRSAEAHQPVAGHGKVGEQVVFFRGGRRFGLLQHEVAKTVPGQVQMVDEIHDVGA